MGITPARINSLYSSIGNIDGRDIPSWSPVTHCDDRCLIYDDCEYIKKGKCSLERAYMNGIFYNIINPDITKGIADQLTDIELQRVGIHLIPLYHQLIKMKKEAYAVSDMSYINKQGGISIHPVFKEIRDILKSISAEIKDLKLNEKWERKFGKAGGGLASGGASIEELMEKGDPLFYESLSAEPVKKKKPKKK